MPESSENASASAFPPTRWSLIQSLNDATEENRQQAMAQLCKLYWYPLYAYARKRGLTKPDAEDLTQGFFHRLLANESLPKIAERDQGKLRSYLLTSMQHYLTSDWRKATAEKRGGGNTILSLETEDAEARYAVDPGTDQDPEHFFDQRWASQTFENAVKRLRHEYALGGKETIFAALEPALSLGGSRLDYGDIASILEISVGAARTQVTRFRKQFRALLREEIAMTLGPEDDIEDELHYLQHLLIGG